MHRTLDVLKRPEHKDFIIKIYHDKKLRLPNFEYMFDFIKRILRLERFVKKLP